MVKRIDGSQKPTAPAHKAERSQKTSASLEQAKKAITGFMKKRGETLLGAGNPPVISKHAPRKESERVSTVATPSLNSKRSK